MPFFWQIARVRGRLLRLAGSSTVEDMDRMHHRWSWFAGVVITALILAACGTATPGAAQEVTAPAGTQAETAPLPTNVTLPTSTSGSGAAATTQGNTDPYGISNDLDGHELIAQRSGLSAYSGYACVISPQGCACET